MAVYGYSLFLFRKRVFFIRKMGPSAPSKPFVVPVGRYTVTSLFIARIPVCHRRVLGENNDNVVVVTERDFRKSAEKKIKKREEKRRKCVLLVETPENPLQPYRQIAPPLAHAHTSRVAPGCLRYNILFVYASLERFVDRNIVIIV